MKDRTNQSPSVQSGRIKKIAKFAGTRIETCAIGSSKSLRAIYRITDPEGSEEFYALHKSQITGMGRMKSEPPTHGRVHGWVGFNGAYSKIGVRLLVCHEPQTIEVEWQPRWEVAAKRAAIALVGRAHLPAWQRDRTPPTCTLAEATAHYTPEKFPGWTLDSDTGHGALTPCPDLRAQKTRVRAQLQAEFRLKLEKNVLWLAQEFWSHPYWTAVPPGTEREILNL